MIGTHIGKGWCFPTFSLTVIKYKTGRTFKKGYTINELRVLKLLTLQDFGNIYEAINYLYENVVPQDVSILKMMTRRKVQYTLTHLIDRMTLKLVSLGDFKSPYEAINYLYDNTVPEDVSLLKRVDRQSLEDAITDLINRGSL